MKREAKNQSAPKRVWMDLMPIGPRGVSLVFLEFRGCSRRVWLLWKDGFNLKNLDAFGLIRALSREFEEFFGKSCLVSLNE